MSVDLDIAACSPKLLSHAILRREWARWLRGKNAGPLPAMLRIGEGKPLPEHEMLQVGSHCYFDKVDGSCTLSLSVMPNEGNLDEVLYLRDYGRNLGLAQIESLAQRWRLAGLWYEVSSGGGRARDEPELLIALACAVADFCEGVVILMNDDVFDLTVGVYTPRQFAGARWLR